MPTTIVLDRVKPQASTRCFPGAWARIDPPPWTRIEPRPWTNGKIASAEALLRESCPQEHKSNKGIIQSSFDENTLKEDHISPSSNGFVWSLVHAYSNHHHVSIRPEDVWFAILVQLSFYVNGHAEELRAFFVDHQGTRELEVIELGTRYTVDFGALAIRMSKLIQKNVVDSELRDWIVPAFTTTTDSDRVIASILMMGALQKYFSYRMTLGCGIPSVTLLGEREDWEKILGRLDKITQLGEEPTTFATTLRPIIRHFIASFDDLTSPSVLSFWAQMIDRQCGSGVDYATGWITGFVFWDGEGKSLRNVAHGGGFKIDEAEYHCVNLEDLPSGYSSVPVLVDDNGHEFKSRMVAGSVGIKATAYGMHNGVAAVPQGSFKDSVMESANSHSQRLVLDMIQPVTGWWIYEDSGKLARSEFESLVEDEDWDDSDLGAET